MQQFLVAQMICCSVIEKMITIETPVMVFIGQYFASVIFPLGKITTGVTAAYHRVFDYFAAISCCTDILLFRHRENNRHRNSHRPNRVYWTVFRTCYFSV